MKSYALLWCMVHCVLSFQLRHKSTLLLSRQYLSQAVEDATVQQETVVHSKLVGKEINRRRNFAIISHPDAGKTTLTEKLLLFGGAIQDAGAVKAKADQRKATSDWMEIEKQRGISVTSTVLSFEFSPDGSQNKYQLNLLDTPGHQDFSEDTYRTLAAADNCVMLIDAAKGIEDRTRKLFDVCKMRKLPIFSFANKLDRPSLSPFDVVDQIEKEFGLECCPMNWPIGDGEDFQGVYDRGSKEVHLFQRGHRRKKVEANVVLLGDPLLQEIIGAGLYNQLMEDIDVLDSLVPEPDLQKIQAGQQTPLFFGSAMTNFGVEIFLKDFLRLARSPAARTALVEDTVVPVLPVGSALSAPSVAKLLLDAGPSVGGLPSITSNAETEPSVSDAEDINVGDPSSATENALGSLLSAESSQAPSPSSHSGHSSKAPHTTSNTRRTEERLISPHEPEFSGFVFKLQANLDPKHRDRMAFVRICSGVFRKGMKVQHSRMRRSINLSAAQSLFAQEREAVVEAYPGDVIGIHNPGIFAIGDTIYTGPARITYPGIPSFSPEKFAYLRNPNPSAYKKFLKGLSELLDEGAVQMLRDRGDDGNGAPLLAAVGQLQFEVVTYRLKGEYGVDSRMDPLDYTMARWANGGWVAVEAAESAGKLHGVYVCKDRWDRPVLLFRNPWKVQQLVSEVEALKLEPWAMPPTEFT